MNLLFLSRRLLALGALLSLPLVAHAQTAADALRFSQRSGAIGARNVGLAGVGTAGFADPSALLTNPAGLGFYGRSEVSGALGFASVGDQADYAVGSSRSSFDASVEATRLDHLTFVSRVPTVQGSLVFAAAYQQTNPFDRTLSFRGVTDQTSISTTYLPFASEYEINGEDQAVFLTDPPFIAYNAGLIEYLPENLPSGDYPFYEAVKPGSTIEQKGQVVEKGVMQELAFGGAVEAARDVMLGLSSNISFGRYEFTSRFEEFDVNGENAPEDYIVLLDNRELRGFDRLRVTNFYRSDLLGINFRGGLSARVSGAPLRFGLTVETPTWYSVNEDYGTEMETVFDEGGSLIYGGVEDEAGSGEFEYTLRTPWRFGAGVAFDTGALMLTGDVESVDWSEMEFGTDAFYQSIDDANRDIADTYRRVFNTRVGAEYRFQALTLRAGLAYAPDARKESDVFSEAQDLNRARTTVSAGLSYSLNRNAALDVGWMRTEFDDAYLPYTDPEIVVPRVDETVTRNRFSLGVRIGL